MQSRSQPSTRWSPGHVINNNTALWACGPPPTVHWEIYRGWIWFIKIILLQCCTCPLHPIHPGQEAASYMVFGPAPVIPTVHHIHVPVHICHPGFWANPSKMKSFVDVARHFLCFRPIHKLLSGAKCKSTPGARSRSPGEGADGTSLMQILSREIWGGHCGRAEHWIVINCDTNEAAWCWAGAGAVPTGQCNEVTCLGVAAAWPL